MLTSDKEFAIWESKNNKAYALIATSVNEEVSRHISPFSNAFEALQNLKEFYDSHSVFEVVQLMIKLFSFELQNDVLLALALEVKYIMHVIKVTNVELDIPLIAFVKALYPTYSNYLESLQANGNLKEITFDSFVNKFAEREKAFGKKTTQSSEEAVCLAHREKNHAQDSSRERGGRRGRGRKNFKGRGADTLKEKSLIFIAYVAIYEIRFAPQALRVSNPANQTQFRWIRVRKSGHVVTDWDTSNPEHALIRTLQIRNVFRSGHSESENQEPAQPYKGVFPHSICTFTCLICCGCLGARSKGCGSIFKEIQATCKC